MPRKKGKHIKGIRDGARLGLSSPVPPAPSRKACPACPVPQKKCKIPLKFFLRRPIRRYKSGRESGSEGRKKLLKFCNGLPIRLLKVDGKPPPALAP